MNRKEEIILVTLELAAANGLSNVSMAQIAEKMKIRKPSLLLSVVSLVVIMIGGYRNKKYRSLAIWATIALLLMFAGAIGTNIVPRDFFWYSRAFQCICCYRI